MKRNFFFFLETLWKMSGETHHQRAPLGWGNRKSAKTKRAENLLEALMVRVMTCSYLFLLCSGWRFLCLPWHIHSPLSMLPIKWKRFCTFFLAVFPTVVFTTLPLSSTLPHAGFLLSLIFSSASSRTFCFVRIHIQYLSSFTALSFLHLTSVRHLPLPSCSF